MSNWWKKEVVYQIYPRSFQDTDSDGIGDLKGIIKRLDYLENLGVGTIWLSPVYQSPNFDYGYDISDYEAINPEYGTMEDFDCLLQEAENRNIKIIMDLVLNHTSDQHHWFLEAKKGKDNPYRDYYIWRDPVNGQEPTKQAGGFGGSAWEYNEASGQYYFHLFSKHQPDLNWENASLRQELYKMMNYWLSKGVKGFRLDVIDLIGKVPDKEITVNGPNLHEYIQEMNRETFGKSDALTVGEAWSASPQIAQLYTSPERKELSMVFSFEHMVLDEMPGTSKWNIKAFTLPELKRAISKWQTALGETGWNSLFWNNHDLPRIISRWGNDTEYRIESGKMFAILLHLLKGTPFMYQGEEIGMLNYPFTDISQIKDIESKMMYNEYLEKDYPKEEILRLLNKKGRDNARTPVQWDDTEYAGFSDSEPWLPVNADHKSVNVETALTETDSIFYTYQKLIRLRKENPIVVEGQFRLLLADHPQIFAYERILEGERWIVAANFSEQNVSCRIMDEQVTGEIIIGNYPEDTYRLNDLELRPYETFAVKVSF